jgi:hypothetical protein
MSFEDLPNFRYAGFPKTGRLAEALATIELQRFFQNSVNFPKKCKAQAL